MAIEDERYVVVFAAGEYFGLRAPGVLKVIEPGPLARVPRIPPEISGVTAYRGRVITVVDLALLLGQKQGIPVHTARRVVLMDSRQRNLGLLVASVAKIATTDQIDPRRDMRDDDLVMSVASCGEMTVGLIDSERLAKKIAGLCEPV